MLLLAVFPCCAETVCLATGAPETAGTNPLDLYNWLLAKQGTHGILGNQENEDFSGLYANALAAICYIHQGDLVRAHSMFSFFQSHLDIATTPPGGFPQFWDASTGQPNINSDRWIGDNAWLLIALNHYLYVTRDDTFEDIRYTIAQWLIGLQVADGGILAGYNTIGLMNWKSTEGNLDCYAALIDYPTQRQRVRDFLVNYMWIRAEGRFRMGSTVSQSSLDGCSFGVGALGSDFAMALQYAESVMLRQEISDATGNLVTGFSDFPGENRIWIEGTGQMIVAYRVVGQHDVAQSYIVELDKAIFPSVRFPGTKGLACHTNNPSWATGSTTIFVPSQAWYLFGAWGFNPMAYEYHETVDFNADGRIDFKDHSILTKYWDQNEPSVDVGPPPSGDGRVDSKDLRILAQYWLRGNSPGQAGNISPLNGAINVDPNADLSWSAGTGAASHDVYFGTSNPPPFVHNQIATAFAPGTMAIGTTYYWRIDEINPWGATIGMIWSFKTMFLEATNPNPFDGAGAVNTTACLSWTPGLGAVSHDVYFGTSNPPPFVHNQADTTFDPGTMAYLTMYYWRIDEVSDYQTVPGSTWNFETIISPPP